MGTRTEKRVERLEAELKEKRAQLQRERNAQLVALGVMIETSFKRMTSAEKSMLNRWADSLDKKTKQRVTTAFERLEAITMEAKKPPKIVESGTGGSPALNTERKPQVLGIGRAAESLTK